MNRSELIAKIKERKSFLCVGLDPDLSKIPEHLKEMDDPVFEFNKAIIDATRDLAVAYKPNLAFYECLGLSGWESLIKTMDYLGDNHFTIADAKRGDIGNTSRKYAETFFKAMDFDSITVAPYMGSDSVEPFLNFEGKWVILLALTSNPGADDFQFSEIGDRTLFETVLAKSQKWGNTSNLMYVVGATRPEYIERVRKIAPDHFLLVPGVGAQGGSLSEVSRVGLNKDVGLLVNSSRGIIYAGKGRNFAEEARDAAKKIQEEMRSILEQNSVI